MALPNSEKITSQLASMPDQALKQMAMMHKADPYVLPLIISEDGRRKQMRQSAMARMAAPQPKVADAAVQQMGAVDAMGNVTGYAAGGLPEDQGIAQLKAPNIAHMADGGIAGYDDASLVANNEPVLRMAAGGMPGYAKGGLTEKQEFAMQYKDLAEKVGKELGVDPGIIISQWGLETGWGKKPVGDFNLGNIKDVTGKGPKAYDKMEKSKSSYKSYESPEAFAADYTSLIKRNFPNAVGAGSDIGAFSAGLQSGKKGAYATDPNYRKSLASTYNSLPSIVPSAQAGELPQKQQAAAPAQPEKAGLEPTNAGNYTGMGMVAATNATAGIQSLKDVSKALFKPGTTANQARRVLGTAAVVPQAVLAGGYAASDKAMNDLQYMSQDQRRALAANPMLSAMSGDAGLAGAIMDAAANNPEGPSKMPYGQQMLNVAKTFVGHPDIDRMREANKAKVEKEKVASYDPNNMVPISPDEFGSAVGIPEPVQEKAVETAKEALPEKKGFSFDNEDLLSLGLRLMANKSKDLLTAAGEAGIGALSDKKEREKAATEKAYKESQTKYQTAYADAIERGAKEKNEQYQAETLIQKAMSDWDKNNKIISIQDPTARMREEERIRQQVYANLGLKPIMAGQAAPAGGGDFKIVGVR